ncbi:MAG: hypothetical protein H0T85_11895 [Geodermatophilaceae bacterium]|nr:hypothetical protein [Geodermatophilaceae bacterium]
MVTPLPPVSRAVAPGEKSVPITVSWTFAAPVAKADPSSAGCGRWVSARQPAQVAVPSPGLVTVTSLSPRVATVGALTWMTRCCGSTNRTPSRRNPVPATDTSDVDWKFPSTIVRSTW